LRVFEVCRYIDIASINAVYTLTTPPL